MTNRRRLLIGLVSAIVSAFDNPMLAQPGRELIVASQPVEVYSGDHAMLCVTNFGPRPVTVTLEFMDAITDAVVASNVLTLGRIGSNNPSPGACEKIVVSKAVEILIGLIKVTGMPPDLTGTLVGSLEVIGAGRSGEQRQYRYLSLTPVSGRCHEDR